MDRPYVLVRKESHETEGGVRASLGSQSDGGISSRGRMKRHDPRRCPLGRHRGDKVCQRGTPPGWVFPETSGEAVGTGSVGMRCLGLGTVGLLATLWLLFLLERKDG